MPEIFSPPTFRLRDGWRKFSTRPVLRRDVLICVRHDWKGDSSHRREDGHSRSTMGGQTQMAAPTRWADVEGQIRRKGYYRCG